MITYPHSYELLIFRGSWEIEVWKPGLWHIDLFSKTSWKLSLKRQILWSPMRRQLLREPAIQRPLALCHCIMTAWTLTINALVQFAVVPKDICPDHVRRFMNKCCARLDPKKPITRTWHIARSLRTIPQQRYSFKALAQYHQRTVKQVAE